MKKSDLSIFLKPMFAILLLFYWTYVSWVLLDLRSIKTQMPQLAQLQKENIIQKKQFLELVGRIEKMKEKIVALEESELEMEKMVGLGTLESSKHFLSARGWNPDMTISDYPDANTLQEPVPLIPHSMGDIEHGINSEEVEELEEGPSSAEEAWEGKEDNIYPDDNENDVDREQIRKHLIEIAIELGIDPRLALSMAKVESGYDPSLVSPKGAVGVLQVMPQFVNPDYGITEEMLFDPYINIRVGLSKMKSLLKRFDHDLELSLAAYNAGASRVVKSGYRIPPIKETEAYVRKVKDIMENDI